MKKTKGGIMKTTMSILFLGLILLIPKQSYAFKLTCKAETKDQYLVYAKTEIDCHEPKSKSTFSTRKDAIGGTIQIHMFSDDSNDVNPNIFTIMCPLMTMKKLKNMNAGDELKIFGAEVAAEWLIGVRAGIYIGKPGVCFLAGASFGELGLEAVVSQIKLKKQP